MTGRKWHKTEDKLPPENTLVEIRGVDFMGQWFGLAQRVPYKRPQKKRRQNWRWCFDDGTRYPDQAVEAWSLRVSHNARVQRAERSEGPLQHDVSRQLNGD